MPTIHGQVAITFKDLQEEGSPKKNLLPIRPRSLSASSFASSSQGSQDSWSERSSSYLSLECDQIKSLFSTLENLTIKGDGLEELLPIHLTLGDRPSSVEESPTRKRRKSSSVAIEDQLNPAAMPFVPGGTKTTQWLSSGSLVTEPEEYSSPNDGLYEVISMHSPSSSNKEYIRPPGLSLPAETSPVIHGRRKRHESYQPSSMKSTTSRSAPSWYNAFAAGTNPAIDVQIREFNAHSAVSSNANWAEDEMGSFASQFSSQAYFATENPLDTIAEFAASSFHAFELTHGPMLAQSFMWSLRHHALNAFMTSWDTVSLDPSLHPSAGLSQHVISSISLARFIGDLFKRGLLSKSHVTNCISKILEAPCTEEHIVALGYLVVRSGPELWMNVPNQLSTEEFIVFAQDFSDLAFSVQYSLVGGEPGYSAVWVDEINARFAEWETYYTN